jgi:hypothetical protein
LITYHIGPEAWLILPLEQLTPVDIGEEMVGFDFCGAIGTKSAVRITIEESSQKIPRSGGDNIAAWEGQGFLQNLSVHIICVLVIERWKTGQHLIEKHT